MYTETISHTKTSYMITQVNQIQGYCTEIQH